MSLGLLYVFEAKEFQGGVVLALSPACWESR